MVGDDVSSLELRRASAALSRKDRVELAGSTVLLAVVLVGVTDAGFTFGGSSSVSDSSSSELDSSELDSSFLVTAATAGWEDWRKRD